MNDFVINLTIPQPSSRYAHVKIAARRGRSTPWLGAYNTEYPRALAMCKYPAVVSPGCV